MQVFAHLVEGMLERVNRPYLYLQWILKYIHIALRRYSIIQCMYYKIVCRYYDVFYTLFFLCCLFVRPFAHLVEGVLEAVDVHISCTRY